MLVVILDATEDTEAATAWVDTRGQTCPKAVYVMAITRGGDLPGAGNVIACKTDIEAAAEAGHIVGMSKGSKVVVVAFDMGVPCKGKPGHWTGAIESLLSKSSDKGMMVPPSLYFLIEKQTKHPPKVKAARKPRVGGIVSECYICSQTLWNDEARGEHALKVLECPVCQRQFCSKGKLATHCSVSHPVCEVVGCGCGVSFESTTKLRQHEKEFCWPVRCKECNVSLPNIQAAVKHAKGEHGSVKQVQVSVRVGTAREGAEWGTHHICNNCGKFYMSRHTKCEKAPAPLPPAPAPAPSAAPPVAPSSSRSASSHSSHSHSYSEE